MSQDPHRLRQALDAALRSGNLRGAESLLRQRVAEAPDDLPAWLNLAGILRQFNDLDGAQAAVRAALTLEPRNFHGLLMQAVLLEKSGQAVPAAQAYGVALFQAPPDAALDPATLQAVQHGRAQYERYRARVGAFVRDRAAPATEACSAAERRRLDAFVGIALRQRQRYQQQPMEYDYPGLPSIEFYERGLFPWLEDFEATAADVRAELDGVLAGDAAGLAPYIHYDRHLPLDQWAELNHSPRWSAYHFYDRAERIEAHCARAPRTVAAVERLPQARVPRRSPTAMFSVLQPHTRIPPHTGIANFRLVVHLPLVLPGQCGFRVGGETREWRAGEAWVFDDTIEHEAWNDSDAVRVILICDIWSPLLSPEEQAAIAAVIAATDDFQGTVAAPGL